MHFTDTMENDTELVWKQTARRKSSTKYAWGPSSDGNAAARKKVEKSDRLLPRLPRKKEGFITALRRSLPSPARDHDDEIDRIKRANRRDSLGRTLGEAYESRPNSARSDSPESSNLLGGDGGNNAQNIWNEFENHIKSIDDDSSKIRTFQQNKVNFRSSETFQKVAGEFRSEKIKHNIGGLGTNIRIKRLTANRANKQEQSQTKNEENVKETVSPTNVENKTGESKSMHWSVIKQGVKEVQEEKKDKAQDILQATSQLNEMDLKKQDLYIRYGIIAAKGHTKPTNVMIPKINPRFVSKEFLASYKVLHPTLDYLDYREGRPRRSRRVQSAFT